ncbi:hypothetical protein I5Q23_23005 [Serratia marcescens]|nr:hypothetical protein [Serratia marcescens]
MIEFIFPPDERGIWPENRRFLFSSPPLWDPLPGMNATHEAEFNRFCDAVLLRLGQATQVRFKPHRVNKQNFLTLYMKGTLHDVDVMFVSDNRIDIPPVPDEYGQIRVSVIDMIDVLFFAHHLINRLKSNSRGKVIHGDFGKKD